MREYSAKYNKKIIQIWRSFGVVFVHFVGVLFIREENFSEENIITTSKWISCIFNETNCSYEKKLFISDLVNHYLQYKIGEKILL